MLQVALRTLGASGFSITCSRARSTRRMPRSGQRLAGPSPARPALAEIQWSSPGLPSAVGAAERPEISVILPFHAAEGTIRSAIDSVLAQTFTSIELVCINDTSSDGSPAIVDECRQRDTRIVVVRNETNLGHGASRNRGVAHSRGRFVFHLDPDDILPSDALTLIHRSAVSFGSDMTRGAYVHEQVAFGDARPRQNAVASRRGRSRS